MAKTFEKGNINQDVNKRGRGGFNTDRVVMLSEFESILNQFITPGGTIWGTITGNITDQTDLNTTLNNRVPYTGATSNININNKSLTINATATGNGFIELSRTGFNTISGPTAGIRFGASQTNHLAWSSSVDMYTRIINGTLTTHRNYTLPDVSGTIALINGGQTFTNFFLATGNGIDTTTVGTMNLGLTNTNRIVYGNTANSTVHQFFGSVGIGVTTPNNAFQVANLINFKDNTNGSVYIGYQAGNAITTGINNTVYGWNALLFCISGSENSVFGMEALRANTSNQNSAFGHNALRANVGGDQNTALGYGALSIGNGGSLNVAAGKYALAFATSDENIGVGGMAGYKTTTGNRNVYLGTISGYNQETGTHGVYLGYGAGYYETGDKKLFIDTDSRASEADGRIKSLVYGIFDASVSNQLFRINGDLHHNGTKLAFYGGTPITQPTTGIASATYDSNVGNIVNDTDTFDGYTIAQVVRALRNGNLNLLA